MEDDNLENGFKIKKTTLYGIGFVVVLGVIGFLFMGGNGITGGAVASLDVQDGGLSGNIAALDPDRPMAGSPCHNMGGRYMGDCEVREIDLIASQWDWSEPTITVKSGELVKIKATSTDVSHGIVIPDIGFNLRIYPDRTTTGEFIAPEPGQYVYGCSVVCGRGHGNHKGKLVVI